MARLLINHVICSFRYDLKWIVSAEYTQQSDMPTIVWMHSRALYVLSCTTEPRTYLKQYRANICFNGYTTAFYVRAAALLIKIYILCMPQRCFQANHRSGAYHLRPSHSRQPRDPPDPRISTVVGSAWFRIAISWDPLEFPITVSVPNSVQAVEC